MDEDVKVTIQADTAPFADALSNLEGLAQGFGSQLTGALKSAATSGRSLEDVLRRIGLNLAGMALNQGLAPLQGLASSALSSFAGGLAGIFGFAKGGVPGRVTPFAAGGVVAQPTYFPMNGGMGLMGEAGAEAIMPLQRTADGRLGVAASGHGAGAASIVVNIQTPDAASFRKSVAQVAGMLARAVSRGMRTR